MAIVALPPKRAIIVGAGASLPYGLPLAGSLLQDAGNRILDLDDRRVQLARTGFLPDNDDIARNNYMNRALLRSIKAPSHLQKVAGPFREHLVQQNLDDFVRDHPSLTSVVSMLITIALISAMYRPKDGMWELSSDLRKSGLALESDWMRLFVGVVRPMASAENKLHIISFNYDSLLERSMRMYWSGSEIGYAKIDDAVEFIYPNGKFSDLPERLSSLDQYLNTQAEQLRLGNNHDRDARDRAKAIIDDSHRIFSVGFSFSDDNTRLLGLDHPEKFARRRVQNYQYADTRLKRLLDQMGVTRVDNGDMNALIRNGFFEQ
jgi:hypothetical protein